MKRRKNDVYYTPEWLVNQFLARRLDYGIRGSILEPCCGNGAISNSLKEIMVHGGLGATKE